MDKTEVGKHWSQKKEVVSSYSGLHLLLVLFRLVPAVIIKIMVMPVTLFYFIFNKTGREHSIDFLKRVDMETGNGERSILVHFMSFTLNLVEKMESWSGRFSFDNILFQHDDVDLLVRQLEDGKGAMLICSHLGNTELLRSLAELNRTGVSRKVATISIVDFTISPQFSRMMEELNPDSMNSIISARDIGPDTVIILQQHIESGGLVVIAGDRTSATTADSFFTLPFLGKPAPFASGPFILAMILDAPCYAIFGLREKKLSLFPKYKMYVNKLDIPERTSRKERKAAAQQIALQFSRRLENLAMEYPYQWYNFYNFWAEPTL